MSSFGIRISRVYDPPSPEDGTRVLVDRLWPRGMSKEKAKIDVWLRDISPSPELRTWFGHQPERWEGFLERYRAELEAHPEAVDRLLKIASEGPVTLVYSARDPEHNQAVAILNVLEDYLIH
jgi:uncharacterized protein YeaO (DUF488 family)